MAPKKFLRKLQEQPESTRKFVLWGVTGIVGVVLFFWWFIDVKNSIEQSQQSSFQEQMQLDLLQEDLANISEELSNGGQ